MQAKVLDNKSGEVVGDILKQSIKSKSQLSIIAAHFTIYAFDALKTELEKIENLRLLLSEPSFSLELPKSQIKNPLNQLFNLPDEIMARNQLEQVRIAKECAEWIKQKVLVKSVSQTTFHNPMISVLNKKHDDFSIVGTQSFSLSGLGYTYSNSFQMNTFMPGTETTQQYLKVFDSVWDDDTKLVDVKANILKSVEHLYQNHTAEYLYYVTLYNIFGDYLGDIDEDTIVKSKTGFKDTEVWNRLYKFQKDGVLGTIDKLEKYNGCIIADSVGLGKTFEALAVIKYYELRNDRVLVLCPKKLRENWLVYIQNDTRNILSKDRFNYDVLNHTDLSRESGFSGDINLSTINWSNYDLVVIDESHNFRNNPAYKDRETRYSKLMEQIIKSGVKTKVLMLSATPVNNRMNDLKNQIAFITEGKDDALEPAGIDSIEDTLRKAQAAFNKWQKTSEEQRTTENLMELLSFDYFNLLDAVTIARSRKHIEKYYDMSDIGKFPTRLTPVNIKSEIDENNNFPAIKAVNNLINRLNLSAYSPLKYVLPEKQASYSNKYDKKVKGGSVFKQSDRENSLVHLMRVNLLKRLESSIFSFGKTVAALLNKIDSLLWKLKNNRLNEDISIDSIDIEDDALDDLLIGAKVKVLLQDIDHIKMTQELQEDKENLEKLLKSAFLVQPKDDAKLNELKELVTNKVQQPINLNNKKIIIFTAFSDTAEYLYDNITTWSQSNFNINTALVTGSGSNKTSLKGISKDLNSILTNFSPLSKERHKLGSSIEGEIDILIATDCISEGQNLQDCDYLINYDIHWNPVRIIQRFGRIDRLGSVNDVIQLVNFWPNMDLDEYINLAARVNSRMVLLDISATGEENVIQAEEGKAMNDLAYRAKQLKQLQEEVIDLEDMSGGISITDLTLNDFKMDLIDYMDRNKDLLEHAPKGMHAILSKESLNQELEPGVLFCLKQISGDKKGLEINSLFPHYVLYISFDGEVQLGHLKAKQILDVYRKLAIDNKAVNDILVRSVQVETSDYADMSSYKKILDQSIAFILDIVEEQGMASLFTLGDSSIDTSSTNEDFEVISYLIVK